MTGKAILWDNDGVLVNTERWFFESNRRALAALGVEATWAHFEDISLTQGESLLEMSGLEGEALGKLYLERDAIYCELLRNEEIEFPGMRELLGRLREDFTMGIVTSCRRMHFEIIHERAGLVEEMGFCVIREDYERGKPHADGYLMGVERAGLRAEECIAVEDSPRGVASARAAGVECVFFCPDGVGREREAPGARCRVESVGELEAVLRAWGA